MRVRGGRDCTFFPSCFDKFVTSPECLGRRRQAMRGPPSGLGGEVANTRVGPVAYSDDSGPLARDF